MGGWHEREHADHMPLVWVFVSIIGGVLMFGPLGLLYGPLALSISFLFLEIFFDAQKRRPNDTQYGLPWWKAMKDTTVKIRH